MTAKERMHLAANGDTVRILDVYSLDVVRCAQKGPDAWHAIHDDPAAGPRSSCHHGLAPDIVA